MCSDISSWVTYFGAVSGVIGASAWLAPWAYSKFSKPTLKARTLSLFANSGKFNNKNCLLYFLALNITSLKKCFNIDTIQISVTYEKNSVKYLGEVHWARKNEWAGPSGERLSLDILPENTLPFIGTLPKNITKKVYLTFNVDKADLEDFKEIELIFIEQSSHSCKIIIKNENIKEHQLIWDDRIWKDVTKK